MSEELVIRVGKCECCLNNKEIIGTACVPGFPISIQWCWDCLNANVIPYNLCVYSVADCEGFGNMDYIWAEMIRNSIQYHNKTIAEFNKDVQEELKHLNDNKLEILDEISGENTET